MWTWSTFNSCFPQNVYKRGALSAAELQARGVWVSFVTTGICGPSSHPIVTACQRAICALVLSFHEEVDGRSSSATFHLHCLQERLESKPKELMRRKKKICGARWPCFQMPQVLTDLRKLLTNLGNLCSEMPNAPVPVLGP